MVTSILKYTKLIAKELMFVQVVIPPTWEMYGWKTIMALPVRIDKFVHPKLVKVATMLAGPGGSHTYTYPSTMQILVG